MSMYLQFKETLQEQVRNFLEEMDRAYEDHTLDREGRAYAFAEIADKYGYPKEVVSTLAE